MSKIYLMVDPDRLTVVSAENLADKRLSEFDVAQFEKALMFNKSQYEKGGRYYSVIDTAD